MDLGVHAATIWACYGVVAAIIGGLIIWLIVDGRQLAGQIARLEARGIRRRSSAAEDGITGDANPEPNARP